MSHWVPDAALPLERRLPRLGAGQEHRGEHRQHEQRQQRVAHAQPGRQRAVEDAGAGQADGGQQAGRHGEPHDVHPDVEEEGDAGPEDHLEHEQLEADGGRLAQEDARRVDAREPQPVARALARTRRRRCAGWPARSRTSSATQKMPGAAWRSDAWSGPMANARRTRTSTANGTTCQRPTRERGLDAQVLAGDQDGVMPHARPPRPRRDPVDGHRGERDAPAARLLAGRPARPPMDTTRSASGHRELGLVRGQQHRRAVGHGLGDQLAQQRARGGVEPGVRLVEQPEGGAAGDQRGEGDAAALAGREPAGRRRAQASGQAEALERVVGARDRAGRGRARRSWTFSAALSSS